MATNLSERIEILEEILAAVGYEFGELVPPEAISDSNIATKFWERAKEATYNAVEAMGDLVAIVANWDEMTAATPAGGVSSEDGAGGAAAEC
jgi:hypothetical protein